MLKLILSTVVAATVTTQTPAEKLFESKDTVVYRQMAIMCLGTTNAPGAVFTSPEKELGAVMDSLTSGPVCTDLIHAGKPQDLLTSVQIPEPPVQLSPAVQPIKNLFLTSMSCVQHAKGVLGLMGRIPLPADQLQGKIPNFFVVCYEDTVKLLNEKSRLMFLDNGGSTHNES